MSYKLLPLLFFAVPALAAAPGITIEWVSLRAEKNLFLMEGETRYNFSDEALEALSSGVPLNFMIEIEVRQLRNYFWDTTVAEARENLRLEHHALTDQYLVVNLNTDTQRSFRTIEDAARVLGRVEQIPIIEKQFLDPKASYQVRIRVRLDTESLPPPLRLVAHFSSQWWLSSPWYELELRP